MSTKNEATITVFAILFLLAIMLPSANALTEVIECSNAEMTSATKYTTPSEEQDIDYGTWTDVLTRDGSCNPNQCWGVGINDPANVSGNEIYQEFIFNIPQEEIKELNFKFNACWGGGQNGCGHDDHPEFTESDPGKVQAEIYNGSSWIALGSQIGIGDISASSAMHLTNYSKSINFSNAFLDNNSRARIRVRTTGTFFGNAYDVEMYTDYAGMDVCHVTEKIYSMNITAENDSNESINSTIEVLDENDNIKHTGKGNKHKINASNKNKIKIKLTGNTVKELLIENASINDGDYKIKISNPQKPDWAQACAVDTEELGGNATLTINAAGDKLYQCDDWNKTSQECNGEWTSVMKLSRGDDYQVKINGPKCFKERKNYNVSHVNAKGIKNLDILVDNASIETTDMFTGIKKLEFTSKASTVFYFMHDFDEEDINLSSIKIIKSKNVFVVDLDSQKANNTTKTMYFKDSNFAKLCVKNAETESEDDITKDCTGADEINFDACIGNSTGVTIKGVTCYDEGNQFRIENISYSGIRGTPKAKPKRTPSSGGGGGGGGSSGYFLPACNDRKDNDNDGLYDYPADPGCDSTMDGNEYNEPAEEPQPTETIQSNTGFVEPVEPIEIKPTGKAALENKENKTHQKRLDMPKETITKTKKYTKVKYGGFSIISILISMVVVFLLLRRDKKTAI